MEILKSATDWAKSEVFSTSFFILLGIIFVLVGTGFWQLGKTDMAKAYIIPTLVAGVLLITIGLGLFFTNKSRIKQFEISYNNDPEAFVKSELERVDNTIKEYKNVVFTAIPLILIACSLIIIFFNGPVWRACMISTIAMLVVILLIDGTASARIKAYNEQLILAQEEFKSNN